MNLLVRPGGIEPPTLGLGVPCSIQLSYGRAPSLFLRGTRGRASTPGDEALDVGGIELRPRAALDLDERIRFGDAAVVRTVGHHRGERIEDRDRAGELADLFAAQTLRIACPSHRS